MTQLDGMVTYDTHYDLWVGFDIDESCDITCKKTFKCVL